jgi:2-dehydro-3-deoxyphosphogluconate aldolase/(4S)-4-hydroxy-2-oxoglutarate aldolase
LTVVSATQAVAVCRALQAGGIGAAEITLRTTSAFAAIAAVRQELDEFVVGAGTVKTSAEVEKLKRLGVDFAVSPGLTPTLSNAAFANNLPLLPGVATASEILLGLESGRSFFKLFPAEAVGGMALLKSFAAPFAEVKFCPTGGIAPTNFRHYLSLPNVVCVGGSWMVTPELLQSENWQMITQLSRECMTGD